MAGQDGLFSMNVTLLYGNNTLLIKSTDRAGNANSTVWYVVRTKPVNSSSSPWLAAGIIVVAVLVAENAYLVWRYRGKGPAAASTPGAPPANSSVAGPAPAESLPEGAPAAGLSPPEALPVGVPGIGPVPPEALPVAEIPSPPDGARKADGTETVEMK
jgi:hypothetical protein